MNIEIVHNESEKRFQTVVDGVTAYISYTIYQAGIDLVHTIVPKEIGGRGVAAALTEYVLNYAIDNGMRVRASCYYVRAYIERHKDKYSTIEDKI